MILIQRLYSLWLKCLNLQQSGTLFTGGEDRTISAWDTNSGKLAYSIEDAHPTRIKGVVVLTRNDNDGASEDPYLVGSASSDGIVRVWDMRMAAKEKTKPLAETNTKSRLTCLAGSAVRCKFIFQNRCFYKTYKNIEQNSYKL